MARYRIDENKRSVDCATTDGGEVIPLLVDPVTGRLLIRIKAVDTLTGVKNNSKIDENHKRIECAVDDNDNVVPLHTDNDGNLICDVIIE